MDRELMRFFSHVVVQANGCWEWQASTCRGGYPKFQTGDGRRVQAHRWLYRQVIGDIPADLVLHHKCRNEKCVKPGHMEPVTRHENVHRGLLGARGRQPGGEIL